MINNIVLEGYITDGYKKIPMGRRTSVSLTIIVYNEKNDNLKSKYNRIECIATDKVADFFLDNAKNIVNKKVAIVGSLKSKPDESLYVRVKEIALSQGKVTPVIATRVEADTIEQFIDQEDISTSDERMPY